MKWKSMPQSIPTYSFDPATGDVQITPRERLKERLPPTESRIAGFDALHEQLAVATELFQHRGDGGRYGVFVAMRYLKDYLTGRGIPHATLRPLEAVMFAIVDADNGTSNPIFQPDRQRRGGAPRKPVLELEFEGELAIVMECCVRHCKAEGQRPFVQPAARLAANLFNESEWGVNVSERQLIEIRERVQAGAKDSLDRMKVDQAMSSRAAKAHPLQWAKIRLAHQWINPPPKLSE